MLAKCTHDEPALLSTPGVLEQSINNALFGLCTALSLGAGNFDQRLIHTLDRERLWLSQSETLFLFCFKCHVSGIAMLIIDGFQRSIVQAADLLEGFGDRRAPQPELERNIRRRYRVRRQPYLVKVSYGCSAPGTKALTAGRRLPGSPSISSRRQLTNVSTILIRLVVPLRIKKHRVSRA